MFPGMTDASLDDPTDQLVLHTLVVKGYCSEDAAADATGLQLEAVARALARLSGAGLAQYRDGRISGWSPSPAARARHRELVEGPLAVADRARAMAAYERFSALNTKFKHVCTDWQVRAGADGALIPNEHDDVAYDAAVIARLEEIHASASGVCSELAPCFSRAARYQDRLATALAALEAGDRDRFTRPLCGSYHDVWMELHQDLIVTLGLARTAADT
jgi:hypothetical protein